MTIKELRAQSLDIANKAHALLTGEITAENRSEKEAEFDRMMVDSDNLRNRADRLEAVEARQAEMSQIETRSETRTSENRASGNTETAEATFDQYLRGEISEREYRAHSTGVDAKGGYLVPTSMASQIVASMKEYGPMLDGGIVTEINTGTGNPFDIPTVDETNEMGNKKAENAQAPEQDIAFGKKQLGAQTFDSGYVQVSNELLQDSAFNLEAFIGAALGERIARKANLELTIGTASPQGIVTGSTEGVVATAGDALTSDELLALAYSVNGAYRRNGSFMFADATELSVRKMKDGNGQYVWQPSLQVGKPSTLLGFQYYTNADMAAPEAGAKAAIFGDLSKYWLRRIQGITIKRLEEVFALSNATAFVGFARLDGILTDAQAVKHLKMGA